MELADQLIDTPRHLSQHVGGFVITRSRLDEVVPIENAAMEERTVIEWEKNDLEALGLLKVDVPGARHADVPAALIRSSQSIITARSRDLSLQDEDAATYNMMQRADTIGVFQIESRAQMSMLPRLKPKKFYDLVIEVAIVRPGPIQGNMVHPYLRRTGEAWSRSSILRKDTGRNSRKTLGVPLFQEQAMRIAIDGAGFEPGEADRLRRAMATFKRVGTIDSFREKFLEGMKERGYDDEIRGELLEADRGLWQLRISRKPCRKLSLIWSIPRPGSNAIIPDVFVAALLNSQPMGFYATSQLVRDAQDHGVEVRPSM